MRRLLPIGVVLAAVALLAAQAPAARHSGIAGVILNTTCPGPCASPPPAPQKYTGQVTVSVRRVRDGKVVANKTVSDGSFRFRLGRGVYDVTAVTPGTNPCTPPASGCACIQAQTTCCGPSPAASKVICPVGTSPTVQSCLNGDTQRVTVRHHRFTRVELHVQNVCVV
jgi:hypothetical protein